MDGFAPFNEHSLAKGCVQLEDSRFPIGRVECANDRRTIGFALGKSSEMFVNHELWLSLRTDNAFVHANARTHYELATDAI